MQHAAVVDWLHLVVNSSVPTGADTWTGQLLCGSLRGGEGGLS